MAIKPTSPIGVAVLGAQKLLASPTARKLLGEAARVAADAATQVARDSLPELARRISSGRVGPRGAGPVRGEREGGRSSPMYSIEGGFAPFALRGADERASTSALRHSSSTASPPSTGGGSPCAPGSRDVAHGAASSAHGQAAEAGDDTLAAGVPERERRPHARAGGFERLDPGGRVSQRPPPAAVGQAFERILRANVSQEPTPPARAQRPVARPLAEPPEPDVTASGARPPGGEVDGNGPMAPPTSASPPATAASRPVAAVDTEPAPDPAALEHDAMAKFGLPPDAALHQVLGFATPPFLASDALAQALRRGVSAQHLLDEADDKLRHVDAQVKAIRADPAIGSDPVSLKVLDLLQSAREDFMQKMRAASDVLEAHLEGRQPKAPDAAASEAAKRIAALTLMGLDADASAHTILAVPANVERSALAKARARRLLQFHPDRKPAGMSADEAKARFTTVSALIGAAFEELKPAA